LIARAAALLHLPGAVWTHAILLRPICPAVIFTGQKIDREGGDFFK
jgi:hypothetical protein